MPCHILRDRNNDVSKPSKRLEPADWIIASGAAVPILFDLVAWRRNWKTASVRFGEFLDDPKTRALFVLAWIVVSLHLFIKLPLPFQSYLKRKITGGIQK